MNKQENELMDVAFRINAIYENEKAINILGFSKDKETGVKTNLKATIFKYKMNGEESKAYIEFNNHSPEKGDLLLTSGDRFTMWNDTKQYVIKIVSGMIKSKFSNEEVKPTPAPTHIQETKVEEKQMELVDKEEKALKDVPWALEL